MSRVARWKVTNLSNIANLGEGAQIQQMCSITWTDPDNPEILFTDGKPAVGELTADLGDGTVVPIPVCADCLRLVSPRLEVSLPKE